MVVATVQLNVKDHTLILVQTDLIVMWWLQVHVIELTAVPMTIMTVADAVYLQTIWDMIWIAAE